MRLNPKYWLAIVVFMAVVAGCYPSGDCDVVWEMGSGATWGEIEWVCDVELPDAD